MAPWIGKSERGRLRLLAQLESDGFALLPDLLAPEDLGPLRLEADRLLAGSVARGGARNALARSEPLRELAEGGAPFRLALAALGSGARATRLTVFDKHPRANWKVPFHQDLTIAVRERREVEGFGPWTIKEGLPHVQPPDAVLAQLLAVRLHLDETPAGNGALRVLPGSHRLGRLTPERIEALRREQGEVVCPVPAGGAMLMRPLLLHASSPSLSPSRRRVLHFEYSAGLLPGGLAWE